MKKRSAKSTQAGAAELQELYARPGFLLRRAHQISVSLFMDEAAAEGMTSTQYSVMFILRVQPGLDQISLAKLIGLDRSTTGLVLGKLEHAGLVKRSAAETDRRCKQLKLTRRGETAMRRLAEPARNAQDKMLTPFTAAERRQFIALLTKFVGAYNEVVRTPLKRE